MSIADKLDTIAKNVEKVYLKGYDVGFQDGYDIGYATGSAEGPGTAWCDYNAFWDGLQDLGDRTSYNYAFGTNWTDDMFVPKHRIAPKGTGANDMFNGSDITDLSSVLKKPDLQNPDVALDFSQAESLYNTFSNSKIATLPAIDVSSCKTMTCTFSWATDLEGIVLEYRRNESGVFNKDIEYERVFHGCTSLVNVSFLVPDQGNAAGVIQKIPHVDGLYFGDSPKLSGASVINILSALGTPAESTGNKTYVNKVVFHSDAYTAAEDYYSKSEDMAPFRPYFPTLSSFIATYCSKWTITTK